MFTAEDVKAAVAKSQRGEFRVHKCSLCGYRCGYIFDGDVVAYDSVCYCVRGGLMGIRSWEDVADMANMQTPELAKSFMEDLADPSTTSWRVLSEARRDH